MFTGIIEQTAKILDIQDGVYTVENNFSEPLTLGQSISHDGACMTITDFGQQWEKTEKKRYRFFAMQETLSKTNFGSKNIGNSFNVERCMIYGQRVDGHLVSGHIDCMAQVYTVSKNPDHSWNFSIIVDKQRAKYVIAKGSIAINGISLTVANSQQLLADSQIVTVCLIPYTREHTNLSTLESGDLVNIEFDMMGKYILNA